MLLKWIDEDVLWLYSELKCERTSIMLLLCCLLTKLIKGNVKTMPAVKRK